jgi:hypothetical protein
MSDLSPIISSPIGTRVTLQDIGSDEIFEAWSYRSQNLTLSLLTSPRPSYAPTSDLSNGAKIGTVWVVFRPQKRRLEFGHSENHLFKPRVRRDALLLRANWDGLLTEEGKAGRLTYGRGRTGWF